MVQYSVSSSKLLRISIAKLQRTTTIFKNKSCKRIIFLLMFYPNKISKIFSNLIYAGLCNIKNKYLLNLNNKDIYIKDILFQKKSFLKRVDYKARGQLSKISKPTAKIKIIFTTNKV